MLHKIHVIQTVEQFNLLYQEFKESAIISNSNSILNYFLIGLDTEYISKDNNPESFSKCLNWVHRADKIAVCKLQLATSKLSLVIDLCKFNKLLPDKLLNILGNESWIKIGIGISNDMKYLSYNFNLGQCNGAIDIKIFAELKGCLTPNLLDIYKNVSNNLYSDYVEKIKNKKSNSVIDWSMDMTMEQIEYAGMDAIMSYKIAEYFMNGIMKYSYFDKLENSDKIDKINKIDKIDKIDKINKFDKIDKINKMDKISQSIITATITNRNYIGILQEYSQRNKLMLPTYQDDKCDDKNHRFKISCHLGNNLTYGYGANKKEAKTLSAQKMLEILEGF